MLDDGLVALGLGKYGFRYKNAQRITKKAEDKYKEKAVGIGHSYGGYLAENSGANGDIMTYNKAAGLGDIFTNKKKGGRQHDITTQGDLVSLLSKTQNGSKEVIPNINKTKNFLTAHNTDNLLANKNDEVDFDGLTNT
jgi:butyrate kinase